MITDQVTLLESNISASVRLYESLRSLFFASFHQQVEYVDYLKSEYKDDKLALLKEWCTIKLYGPRRSCHDGALFELIKEFGLSGTIVEEIGITVINEYTLGKILKE